MEFQPSKRSSQTRLSPTAAIVMAADALRQKGIKVIDLGVGEPDFATPQHIKDAAKKALDENLTRYTNTRGILPLRSAICKSINDQFGSDYTEDECCVVVGGKQAIFSGVVSLVNPGDDVLIERPSWVSFPEIVRFSEANVVWVDTEPTDFHMTADQVAAAITPASRLLIINSPSNPTGRVITPAEFRRIVELAAEKNLFVISDECYLHFVYPPHQTLSAAALPKELRNRVLICGSLSKTYAMTGWRIGYALGSREWVNEVVKVQSQSATHPSSICQHAAVAALEGPQEPVREMLAEYQKRADWLIPALNQIPGVKCSHPEGAFYAFPNVTELMQNCGFSSGKELADVLLYEYGVVVTPGAAFGKEGYLRLSYATSMEVIREAVERLTRLAAEKAR